MQQAEEGDGSATGDIAALIEAVEVWRVVQRLINLVA